VWVLFDAPAPEQCTVTITGGKARLWMESY